MMAVPVPNGDGLKSVVSDAFCCIAGGSAAWVPWFAEEPNPTGAPALPRAAFAGSKEAILCGGKGTDLGSCGEMGVWNNAGQTR